MAGGINRQHLEASKGSDTGVGTSTSASTCTCTAIVAITAEQHHNADVSAAVEERQTLDLSQGLFWFGAVIGDEQFELEQVGVAADGKGNVIAVESAVFCWR